MTASFSLRIPNKCFPYHFLLDSPSICKFNQRKDSINHGHNINLISTESTDVRSAKASHEHKQDSYEEPKEECIKVKVAIFDNKLRG